MAKVNHVVNGSTGFANDVAANAYIAANGWAPDVGWEYLDTTLGVVKIWDGGAWVALGAAAAGNISLPGILNYLVVDLGTNVLQNGTQQFPFHTINAALAVAGGGSVVKLFPGTYTEQITPVSGVTLRGVDQARCVLQNLGSGPGDAPIASAAALSMRFENMTILATDPTGGLITQVAVAERIFFRDCFMEGRLDVVGGGSYLELDDNVQLAGQVSINGGSPGTQILIKGSNITGAVGLGVPLVINDPDPIVQVRRSELAGMAGSEAIQWQGNNDNLELEWSKVNHGDGPGNNPFGRTGAETPTYSSHHSRYSLNPEQGGIWTNSLPHGQRHETPNEQSFAAANNQAAVADVVGLVFDATVRSVKVHLSVYVDATGDLCEVFELMIARRGAVWLLTSSATGDTSGLAFTITAAGQVQYTSTNEAGWVSTDLRFVSKVTGV
jgi:Protein of unknown function (DUF1565)